MTGTITPRTPQPVTLTSDEDAYDLLNDADFGFVPEEDIVDAKTAEHVHNALQQMLAENDETAGTIGHDAIGTWIRNTRSMLSEKWGI